MGVPVSCYKWYGGNNLLRKEFNMKSSKPQWQVFLLCAAFGATNAYAAIDISQSPLETGTTVDPNIFFM